MHSKYNKLLKDSITSTYRKADKTTKISIDREARSIAADLKIDDHTECIAPRQAFITLKDYEENFANNPTCRLINRTKSELGIVSKKILHNIDKNIRRKTALNQWKNTAAVLDWFKAIPEKKKFSFTVFDIESFYPSITENLHLNSLNYAKTHFDHRPRRQHHHALPKVPPIRKRHRLGKENQQHVRSNYGQPVSTKPRYVNSAHSATSLNPTTLATAPQQSTPSHHRKNTQRKMIWFNPPYSRNGQTNVGKSFLGIIPCQSQVSQNLQQEHR